ncbi:hypothetical protein QU481_22355 [Crenobacter sp. SG2303]|uniref:Uncharacterized protein n=1 Tax=Crenobacter oryzisoli TaxID=3056844 RepID=A0ABT7XUU1_9NEIS|nr:hypothetical protein [Crenobacter sp. SG2303]MDN0077567.1 hypothetical protein [Crenobacter sp. SG2303]
MATPLPESILKQLPKGYSVLSYQGGELNDDKLTDYIVVIRKLDEESISRNSIAPARPLMLFTQNIDGSYTLARRNDHVVFRIDEGGQCDPFEDGEDGLVIHKHYFTVQNSVACGQHWTDYITFRYAPELHDWVFHKRIFENWVMNNSSAPNADALILKGRRLVTEKGKLLVPFEKYRAN